MTEDEPLILQEAYNTLFNKDSSWPMWIGAVFLSLLSIALTMFLKPWGQSGGVLAWGQAIYNTFGYYAEGTAPAGAFKNPYSVLGITTVLGAFAAALLSRQFNLRAPGWPELTKGLIGGMFMAFGAVWGQGCTLGSFYSGIPSLSGGALVFTAGLIIGVYVAVRWLVFEADRFPGITENKKGSFNIDVASSNKFVQPILGLLVIIFAISFLFFDRINAGANGSPVLMAYAFIGLLIGLILQRSRFCLVRALREPFMTGDSTAAVAAIIGIIAGLIGITALVLAPGITAVTFVFPHFWLQAIIGGIVFGIGMTLAGGCCVGSLWRAGEGQVKLMMATVGMIAFMPLAASSKGDFLNLIGQEANPQFIPNWFNGVTDSVTGTYLMAIGLVLLILTGWYYIVKWNDRTCKLCAI